MKKKSEKKFEKKTLVIPQIKNLKQDLEEVQTAETYLENEKEKLKEKKEIILDKIKKEKEIFKLRKKINQIQHGKKNRN